MNRDLLRLIPTRYLCPYCGEWHTWDPGKTLAEYDSEEDEAELTCSDAPFVGFEGEYRIYFEDDYFHYEVYDMCAAPDGLIKGKIPISSIIESVDKPIVSFEVFYTAEEDVGLCECSDCEYKYKCVLVKLGDEGDHRHMTITLGFEFDRDEYLKYASPETRGAMQKLSQATATSSKEEYSQENLKEETTMTNNNNFFGMGNMEFGPVNDSNIASTMLGIAVKNDDDSWRIYNKTEHRITDVGNMQLGNFPMYLWPSLKLEEGDLIKDDSGEYCYVTELEAGMIEALYPKTGEIKKILPTKNIMNFKCYSKVVAMADYLGIEENLDTEEDMMKMLFMSSMMAPATQEGGMNMSMNALMPLMLLKDKDGGGDDIIKWMAMASMMGGGNNNFANNPMMGYLMLEKFMGKKKASKTTKSPKASKSVEAPEASDDSEG